MELKDLSGTFEDVLTVKRVFGEPYVVDGVTVIPVGKGGGGGGAGEGEGPEAEGGRGVGGGLGFGVKPVGVYVVKDGDVRFVPAVDPQALAAKAVIVLVAGLWCWRSVAKARHKRKALQAKYRD